MKGEVEAELLKSRILHYWVLLHYWVTDGTPPKKEILVPKGKYQTEKGSLTKNIRNFFECRKRLLFKGSYGWSTCQLKIITGMYIKVNAVFLVSGQAE